MRNADTAMYVAKRHGKGTWVMHPEARPRAGAVRA